MDKGLTVNTYDLGGVGQDSTPRPITYRTPCKCGCDFRTEPDMKGYFIFGDGKRGVTIYVKDQELHNEIVAILGGAVQ